MGPIAVVRKPLPLPLPPLPCESNTKVSKFDRNSISYGGMFARRAPGALLLY